jgi:hypothetical protein
MASPIVKGNKVASLYGGERSVKAVKDYIRRVKEGGERPNIYDMKEKVGWKNGKYVEVDYTTVERWIKKYPEFRRAVEELKRLQRRDLQEGILTGKYKQAAGIFLLKANHGMIEAENDKKIKLEHSGGITRKVDVGVLSDEQLVMLEEVMETQGFDKDD